MDRSNVILWILVIAFAALVIYLAATGRFQAMANFVADAYLNFVANIARTLHR